MIELTGGNRIRATNAAGLRHGDTAQVSVRPERILLNNGGSCGIQAKRIEMIYHGAHATVTFRTENGEQVTARLPAYALDSANDDMCHLSFAHEPARAFPVAVT